MRLKIFQVDAFADEVFGGNPAAVCPLKSWLGDATMQAIAYENNLSETAFFVPAGDAYDLRWFTPLAEVDLCGHATLASAHVVFHHSASRYRRGGLRYPERPPRRGPRGRRPHHGLPGARRAPGWTRRRPISPQGSGQEPASPRSGTWIISRSLETEAQVRAIVPDMTALARLDERRGVIVTAPGDNVDFVSRFFSPRMGVLEDPVTGSAHCMLAPFWAERLGKTTLRAYQASARGGVVHCTVAGDRVHLTGRAIQYLEGTITV